MCATFWVDECDFFFGQAGVMEDVFRKMCFLFILLVSSFFLLSIQQTICLRKESVFLLFENRAHSNVHLVIPRLTLGCGGRVASGRAGKRRGNGRACAHDEKHKRSSPNGKMSSMDLNGISVFEISRIFNNTLFSTYSHCKC